MFTLLFALASIRQNFHRCQDGTLFKIFFSKFSSYGSVAKAQFSRSLNAYFVLISSFDTHRFNYKFGKNVTQQFTAMIIIT